jgi:hypothetical protein
MKVGDRVRVKTKVEVFHHPKSKNQPYDLAGQEGTIAAILTEHNGKPISANFPVLVDLGDRFRTHFREDELEIIGG